MIDADAIIDYLHQHPQWLQEHAAQFGLKPVEGKILSFQQGKVAQLNKKTEFLASRLAQITSDGQANHELMTKILAMDKQLLATNTIIQWYNSINTSLTELFHLPHHIIRILARTHHKIRVPPLLIADEQVTNVVSPLSQTICGGVPSAELLGLMDQKIKLGSFLQLPLRWRNQTIAFILIGHEQADYFSPQLQTDWITALADNMAISLARILRLTHQ